MWLIKHFSEWRHVIKFIAVLLDEKLENILKVENRFFNIIHSRTYRIHCCDRHPSTMLLLRKIKQRNNTWLLVVAWVVRQYLLDLQSTLAAFTKHTLRSTRYNIELHPWHLPIGEVSNWKESKCVEYCPTSCLLSHPKVINELKLHHPRA